MPFGRHHRGVEGLVAVRPRRREEVLEAPGNRGPRVVDDAQGGVAVPDGVGDDPDGQEVVDLLQVDLLALELQVDAVETLAAAADLDDGNLRLLQPGRHGAAEFVEQALGRLAPPLDAHLQGLVHLGLEVLERQVLELVLEAAHPEAVGDRRVDVQGLPRGALPPLLGHRGRACACCAAGRPASPGRRGCRPPSPAGSSGSSRPGAPRSRRSGTALILVTPSTRWSDLLAEQLLDLLGGRQRVLDDVVKQACDDRRRVELHVGQDVGDLEGVNEVGLAGLPDLPLVGEGREDVRAAEQLDVLVGQVRLGSRHEIFESDHGLRRPGPARRPRSGFIIGSGSPGGQGAGGGPVPGLTHPFSVHYTGPARQGRPRGREVQPCRPASWYGLVLFREGRSGRLIPRVARR